MRIFHCDNCRQLVYFENFQCLECSHRLAFLPDYLEVAPLEPADDDLWKLSTADAPGQNYRLCVNCSTHNVCNWAVPANDPNPYCVSCRLTRVIPDLGRDGNREAWFAMESAKRRLVYSLLALRLPLESNDENSNHGLAFEFLADLEPDNPAAPKVLTGHANGIITINIAEADDAEREKRRLAVHEPYRTLLGHFRHEVGHYYWDRLIAGGPRLDSFRELFGDEREDYASALERHYENGPPSEWPSEFISAYASSHAWEDWAESWAHYLHMTDTLETASECGLALIPRRHALQVVRPKFSLDHPAYADFDEMITDWFAVTHLLNNLSRGLGQKDSYPFVLSPPAIDKLRFIHKTCTG